MVALRVLFLALSALALPAVASAQATASVQVQVTVVQPPSFVAATAGPAAGAGLGLRLVGSPNCSVTAQVDGATLPMGTCAPVGVLTATAQQAVGRLARSGRTVVLTMTIDAGT